MRVVHTPSLGLALGLAFLALLTTSLASAAPGDASRRYVFLGNDNLPPLIYKDNDRVVGVVIEIAREVAAKANLDADIRAMVWTEAQREVLEGKADALLLINKNPEREALYDFSDPLIESEFTFFRSQQRADIVDAESLQGRTVGVEPGGYARLLMQRFPLVKVQMVPDLGDGFQLLRDGQIDAILTERWAGEFSLAQHRVSGIRIVEPPVERTVSYIAVHKGNRALLESVNLGLRRVREDGTMDRILGRWRDQDDVVWIFGREVFWYRVSIVLALLAVGLSVVIYVENRKIRRARRVLAEEARRRLERLLTPVLLGSSR